MSVHPDPTDGPHADATAHGALTDDTGAREEAETGRGTGAETTNEDQRRERWESPGSPGTADEPFPSGPLTAADEPHVLLLLPEGRDRRLLADLLAGGARVTATTDVGALSDDVDLCVVDDGRLKRHRDALVDRRVAADPLFLPVVLLDRGDAAADPWTWTVVDEVVRVPISRAALYARLQNLLVRRRQSRLLVDREAELESMLVELSVRDRAIAEAPIGITIASNMEPDQPLVYVNDAFCDLTGYDRGEVLGRNCRLLQGEGTDEATVAAMRAAIDAFEPVSVDVVNYTRDGEQFWNKVDIAPVRDNDDVVTHFVGFQTDITSRKLREQELSVFNRVLRHNFRNELNIIDGYTAELTGGDEAERADAIERVQASVGRLVDLSDEVRHVERVFDERQSAAAVEPVGSLLESIRAGIADRHPDVAVRVDAPDDAVYVRAGSLSLGCVDYVSTLLAKNTCDDRRVSVVATHDAAAGTVTIEVDDNGDGLTAGEWAVVEGADETPLQHPDRLGLWVLRWVTTTVGGELLRGGTHGAGGTLRIRCPAREPPDGGDEEDA